MCLVSSHIGLLLEYNGIWGYDCKICRKFWNARLLLLLLLHWCCLLGEMWWMFLTHVKRIWSQIIGSSLQPLPFILYEAYKTKKSWTFAGLWVLELSWIANSWACYLIIFLIITCVAGGFVTYLLILFCFKRKLHLLCFSPTRLCTSWSSCSTCINVESDHENGNAKNIIYKILGGIICQEIDMFAYSYLRNKNIIRNKSWCWSKLQGLHWNLDN